MVRSAGDRGVSHVLTYASQHIFEAMKYEAVSYPVPIRRRYTHTMSKGVPRVGPMGPLLSVSAPRNTPFRRYFPNGPMDQHDILAQLVSDHYLIFYI